jgi:CRP-like cAMP-binding protein
MKPTPESGRGASRETAENPALEAVLARHAFLAGLKPGHVQRLAAQAMRMTYEPGEFIFRAGDPANRFYLIEHGQVVLEARPQNRPVAEVQVLGPGDLLGWSWLFPPFDWQFDARVAAPTAAIFFYGTRLREECEADPEFGCALMKKMTGVAIQRLTAARNRLLAARR